MTGRTAAIVLPGVLLGMTCWITGCGEPKSAPAAAEQPRAALGETVSELSASIWFIHQDSKGRHWFASPRTGVYRHDGKTLTHFTTKHGLADDRLRGMQEDASGVMYFDTLGGVSRFDGTTFTTLVPVPGEWKLEPGDLWFKAFQGGPGPQRYDGTRLYQLTFPEHPMEKALTAEVPNPAASPYEVYTVYRDRRGHMWFGTAARGAYRYDGREHAWLFEDHLTNAPNGGSFGIRSFAEDDAGRLWICNSRHRFLVEAPGADARGMEQVRYTREPGFERVQSVFGNVIYFQAVVNHEGSLWMSTYRDGIWRYDGEKVTRYPVMRAGREVSTFSITKDSDGTLWVGTDENGAYRWNGAEFVRPTF